MVLGTGSDDRLSQLRAGEALSAVLLEATRLALAGCPLSQPLEVGPTRDVLRDDVLGGTLSPQVVIRLGWPGSMWPYRKPTPTSRRDQVGCRGDPGPTRRPRIPGRQHLSRSPTCTVSLLRPARSSFWSTPAQRQPA